MTVCDICLLPKETKQNCSCSLKREEENKGEKEFRRMRVRTLSQRAVIEGRILSSKSWRKRALKELKSKLHCNGTCKNGKIILSGDHNYNRQKILGILKNLLISFPIFVD